MTNRFCHALADALVAALMLAVVAAPVTGATAAEPPRTQPQHETPFVAKMLPIAAGALVGAAAGFFIVPVLVPSVAVAAAAGPPTSPVFGLAGASLGALIGSQSGQ